MECRALKHICIYVFVYFGEKKPENKWEISTKTRIFYTKKLTVCEIVSDLCTHSECLPYSIRYPSRAHM